MKIDTYIPINQLKEYNTYEQVFLITDIKYVNNDVRLQFAKITLEDVTGTISGVIWNTTNLGFKEGQYARIKISTNIYKGQLEFYTQKENITLVEPPLNQFDYVAGISEHIIDHYTNELRGFIEIVQDEDYRNMIGNAIDRLDLISTLGNTPYGLSGPMSYRGGLLVHVVHSLRFADIAIQQAKELEIPFNSSLVVVGCLLRNIGWHTTTLFNGSELRERDAYYTIGIYRASARYIDHLMLTCENDLMISIPESKKQALENICNKRSDIVTVEGKIVSCVDNLADVLDFSIASLKHKSVGNWKDGLFVGHLNE